MNSLIHNVVYEPWPWYVGGPLIGIFVVLFLVIQKKQLGISTSFQYICAKVSPFKPSYLKDNIKEKSWQFWFVIGMIIGGFLIFSLIPPYEVSISAQTQSNLREIGLSDFNGFVPKDIFNFSIQSILILTFGGIAIGFGARYANGCTAGHAIMGCAQLAPASIISTVFFFVGGLIATYFLTPLILLL